MKRLSILGSTGSIGQSTLNLVDLYPDNFDVVALAGGANVERICEQAQRYQPRLVAMADETAAGAVRRQVLGPVVVSGPDGVIEAATCEEADTVVSAITGAAGLLPTYNAILAGKPIALANKETLVMAGELIIEIAKQERVPILPVDSEHNALHQCLTGAEIGSVRRLVLTASGGPFLNTPDIDFDRVTVEQALAHPTWEMGRKISIDSATLMNKGLEVIEAYYLFGVDSAQIDVLVHPQSIVHSLVEFRDGSHLAQLSITDMRSAILYALSYPDRWDSCLPSLNLLETPPLEFRAPDRDRFPCLRLAYEALATGGTAPAALNASNEIAVEAFLNRRIPFSAIPVVIEGVLGRHGATAASDLEVILDADREARKMACDLIQRSATA